MSNGPAASADEATRHAGPAEGGPGEAPPQSLAVLIVGMHRSGTSALSGVLNLLGVAVPEDLHPADQHNARGYFEGQAYIDFHERLLARLGSPSDDPLPLTDDWLRSPVAAAAAEELANLLGEELCGQPLVLFKDPRMCRLLAVWRKALAALARPAVAILPCRRPLEVAGSLEAKAEVPRPHGLMLWLQHVLAGERATRGMRRSFVDYDDLMRDWRGLVGKLERELGLAWPRDVIRASPEIDRFLSADLRHQDRARQPLAREGIEGLCAEAWDHLEALKQAPDDPAAQAGLDALAVRFVEPTRLFGPLVVSYQERLAHKTAALDQAAEERDVLAAALADTVEARDRTLAEKEDLIRAISDDRERAVVERDRVILELVAERDKAINDGHARLVAERARADAALTELERAQAGVRAEAARRTALARRETAELRAQAELHARAADALRARVEYAEAQAAELRATLGRSHGRLGRLVRGGLKASWWTVTLQLSSRLAERRRTIAALREQAAAVAASPPARLNGSPQRRRIVFVSGEPHTPGQLYRVARPAAAAALCGAETSWMAIDEIPGRLDEIRRADILYLWRTPFGNEIGAAVEAVRSRNGQVVFDVDDLMIEPELARVEVIDGIRSQAMVESEVAMHFARIRHSMAMADLCVGATEELAQRMRQACLPAIVLPNAFDHETVTVSRQAVRRRRASGSDGLVRLGYASGSRTHQRDFGQCADAVAEVLRSHPECRLVLFKAPDGPVLFLDEFEQFRGLEAQIEWRDMVPLARLPEEIARFDINLVPLETGNPFCEAKSELKFFEAALVDVATVASPTGPFVRAIRHGLTGMLADGSAAWRDSLERLICDAELRRRMAAEARREVLWMFGPEREQQLVGKMLDLLEGGRTAAQAFELHALRRLAPPPTPPHIPEHEVVFQAEAPEFGPAEVTVVVPLYNYAHHIEEALDSVRAQSLSAIELIVVEDRSTDNSLDVALRWVRANAGRFNRVALLRNRANAGLAYTRNVGFDAADTAYVLTLDADNRLLPDCARDCLQAIRSSGVAFVYPVIRQFGDESGLLSALPYDPVRLSIGNYIDAMALISKAAWVAAGGYDHIPGGWEDFDFWCRLMELGLRGERAPGGPLAEYRVHDNSMIRSSAAKADTIRQMMDELEARHPWLTLIWPLLDGSSRYPDGLKPNGTGQGAPSPRRQPALQNS